MNTINNINKKYFPAIGRIFSPIVLDSLIFNGHSNYLAEVCKNSGLLDKIDTSMPLSRFFDLVYNLLFKNYRNEYIYKNAIANKILLGKHSLNTSSMLTEFRVGRCKADAVILNGTSTVYEIKSELDSLKRLENQLNAYCNIFDHINVITSGSQVAKLEATLPGRVGIQFLTNRNTISTIRESKSNKKNISPDILFDSLRKQEYLKIISSFFGAVPDAPNTLIYRECKKMFCKMPPETAHDLTINVLRKRNNAKLLGEFISVAPNSLSAYALSICNEKSKIVSLKNNLKNSIGSILIPELT